jgi:hypothetical protein
MTRSIVKIGITLIDAGARPEMARWVLDLLKSAHRAYLPTPVVLVDQERAALQFTVDGRALSVLAPRPELACWHRIHPDGSHDQGFLAAPPDQMIGDLFDWLFGQALSQV